MIFTAFYILLVIKIYAHDICNSFGVEIWMYSYESETNELEKELVNWNKRVILKIIN